MTLKNLSIRTLIAAVEGGVDNHVVALGSRALGNLLLAVRLRFDDVETDGVEVLLRVLIVSEATRESGGIDCIVMEGR